MSRRNRHRSPGAGRPAEAAVRPDSPREIQAASLTSPFFREAWSTGSRVTWQQFIDRWERRFRAPAGPE